MSISRVSALAVSLISCTMNPQHLMATQQELFRDENNNGRSHQSPRSIITTDVSKPPGSIQSQKMKDDVLEYLIRRGRCPCKEIENEFQRGQAPIRELRIDGHVIDTRKIEGVSVYVYRGFNRRIRVTDRLRDSYYESAHWKQAATERKSVDGFTCSQCGDRNRLQTHHWRYDLFSEDILFDLQTLCEGCHERLHQRLRGSKVHFPTSVTPVVARELGWAG